MFDPLCYGGFMAVYRNQTCGWYCRTHRVHCEEPDRHGGEHTCGCGDGQVMPLQPKKPHSKHKYKPNLHRRRRT